MNATIAVAIITGALGLVGVFVGGWVTLVQSRRDNKVDTITLIIDSLQEEVTRLRDERDDCSQKISALQDERYELKKMLAVMQEQILDMRAGIQLLIQQLKAAGLEPKWKPGTEPLFMRDSKE